MKIQNKYIIGTMVMFYELHAVHEFVQSIINAVTDIDNKQNITVDFLYNMSQFSEKIDESISKDTLMTMFTDLCIKPLMDIGIDVRYKIYDDDSSLYSIGSYRRDLNYNNCQSYDYIVWGECDCLMPSQYFDVIESISQYAMGSNINRFCITFAVRKMWDASWKDLEHNNFTNCQFLESTDPLCKTDISSIWYYMSIDEMNTINNNVTDYDIRILDYPRFDGSLLTISKDLLLNGVNIPHAVFGTGEDTSFQTMIKIIMGNEYRQFVVKNVLKVHNRNHPFKRKYINGELDTDNVRARRSKNTIFEHVHKCSNYNLSIVGNNQNKFKTI